MLARSWMEEKHRLLLTKVSQTEDTSPVAYAWSILTWRWGGAPEA